MRQPDRHEAINADDVDGPSQIIGERCQAELGANFFEALGEKGALIHPLLDRTERMLADLAAGVEYLGPRPHGLGL